MSRPTRIEIPTFVRIKPGALDRIGVYVARLSYRRIWLIVSSGMVPDLLQRAETSLQANGAEGVWRQEAEEASFERATALFAEMPPGAQAVVGLGGGKALDVAKYIAFLARLPYYAVPTSLSNDGFCSPQSSLSLRGRKRSLGARLPFGVVVDTRVCLEAPAVLWHSGVGDLVSKLTAVTDWKLAYHARGESLDDFAALLSDATVFQFLGRPEHDLEGMRLMATALMLNGVAMEVCGSSRPASGSEHLISHALDETSARPRLHGLQVGMATYICSRLQGRGMDERIAAVFDQTGFWHSIRSDPFSRADWLRALEIAPGLKPDRYTILSERDWRAEVAQLLDRDPNLSGCFIP
jgi:glycerol-1-phosphate dehydrogenase [NAD(P)+]